MHLAKFSQLKFRESVQFANIAKILPRENFTLYGTSDIQDLHNIILYYYNHKINAGGKVICWCLLCLAILADIFIATVIA